MIYGLLLEDQNGVWGVYPIFQAASMHGGWPICAS